MKRLIKKSLDLSRRFDKGDRECALIYINGEIIEGNEHWPLIKQYCMNNFKLDLEKPSKEAEEIDNFLMGKTSDQNLLKEYCMGCKINDKVVDKIIMVYRLSIEGISQDELFSKLQQIYPDYDILLDDVVEQLRDEED